jgi:hypothetical protein
MKGHEDIILSPAQERAFNTLIAGIGVNTVVHLKANNGSGRTTILQKAQAVAGGVLLGIRQFMRALAAAHPLALEESFLQMIEQAFATADLLLIDDLHLIAQVTQNCDYPRTYLLDAALIALTEQAASLGKKLVFGERRRSPRASRPSRVLLRDRDVRARRLSGDL